MIQIVKTRANLMALSMWTMKLLKMIMLMILFHWMAIIKNQMMRKKVLKILLRQYLTLIKILIMKRRMLPMMILFM